MQWFGLSVEIYRYLLVGLNADATYFPEITALDILNDTVEFYPSVCKALQYARLNTLSALYTVDIHVFCNERGIFRCSLYEECAPWDYRRYGD